MKILNFPYLENAHFYIIIFLLGLKAYNQLCVLLTTLLVIRILTVNFPTQYSIKLTGSLSVLNSPSNYKSCLTKAVDVCRKMINHSPTVISSLELGYSIGDALDNVLLKCV